MAAVIRAYREYWDEMLAVGLGVVVTDVVGNTVKGWLEPWLTQMGIAQWADPIAEFLIGAGILAVAEMFLTGTMKTYGRLAAFGATAVAIADAVAILMGYIPTTARPAGLTAPVVRPPSPAPSPAPAAAVTISPRPTTSTAPAKPTIFGS